MADEPRRSGRATKGQHNKDRDIADDSTPKKKGKGKGAKVSKPVEEDEEDQEEFIRCICGEYEEEEDNPRTMICCDKCSAWQHNMCMGLPEDYQPAAYFCEQCRPEAHKDLLGAISRGEKPWVEALRRREAAEAEGKNSKKKGKKGRKSVVAASQSQEVEESPKTTGQKRKAEGTPTAELKHKKVRGTPSVENGVKTASQTRKASTPARAPSQPKAEPEPETATELVAQPEVEPEHDEPEPEPEPETKAEAEAETEASADVVMLDIKDLVNTTRKGAGDKLIQLFVNQIKDAIKAGTYKAQMGLTPQDASTQLGLQVEQALYEVVQQGTGEPGEAYKSQLRSLLFNVKKNRALGERIISNNISPKELASMDPKDMASEEQQKKDAALKEEMDKQHTIIHEQGPRIRRTHKGEEYIDEANQVAAESTTSNAPVRRQSTMDQSADVKSPEGNEKAKKGRQPLSVNTQGKGRPSTDLRRKSSNNFDIDKVWSGVQGSPDGETPRLGEVPQQSSPTPLGGAGNDPDIDNLLKDEENESEPYSPKEFNEEGVVWRGSVNGGNLGHFRTIAKFAAGARPEADTLQLTWEKVVPADIVIHGRIQPQKADDYLCGLQYSSSSDLIIVSMSEPRDREDLEGFEKLFKYFKTKGRYGVGAQHENPAIKDIYLLPMDAGQALPTFIKAIETDFPDPVTERMILVPIVIKNSELPHNMSAAGQQSIMSPSAGPPVAQTPITPQESQTMNGSASYGNPANGTPQTSSTQSPSLNQTPWSPPPQQMAQPPPPPHPQTTNVPPNPTPAVSAAYRILGPQLANSSAVQQLLRQAPNVGDKEMMIVHDCIKENGQAANNLSILTRMLQVKSAQSAQSKENQAQVRGQSQVSDQNAQATEGAALQGQTPV